MTIASIDIGTNTILLLIARANIKNQKIKVLFEAQKIPRIGEGLKPGFPISEVKEKLLLQILASFKVEAEKHNCDRILVTATHAFRIASNRDGLIEKIKNQLQLEVNVVSGIEEAKLTFLGCTNEFSTKEYYAVIDIGGGSTEIIFGSRNKLDSDCSLPFGVVSLTEQYFSNDPPTSLEINRVRMEIQTQLKKSVNSNMKFEKAIAVAGTPTTLACIKRGMTSYDESLIEGEILTSTEVAKFVEELSLMSSQEIKNSFKSVVEGREDVLLAGTILLNEIMNHTKASEVVVSAKGVRYGAVYDFLDKLR